MSKQQALIDGAIEHELSARAREKYGDDFAKKLQKVPKNNSPEFADTRGRKSK